SRSRPIRILLVEDRSSYAELVIHELRRAGLDPRWERVEDESGFRARLDPSLDLILADYNLPQFDAMQALAILKESQMDIPFIIVSGSIGDKAAVESMRSGASDYIFKDNLSRLAAAARRELEAADRRKAEARARAESAARLSAIIGSAPDAVVSIDEGGRILGWNPQAELMFGWTAQEAVGRLLAETIIPPALRQAHTAGLARYLATGEEHVLNRRVEVAAIHRDGREFPVELSIAAITLAGRRGASGPLRRRQLRCPVRAGERPGRASVGGKEAALAGRHRPGLRPAAGGGGGPLRAAFGGGHPAPERQRGQRDRRILLPPYP